MERDEIGSLYGESSRQLQDQFDTRRLADVLQAVTVHDELTADDIELIRAQSTVWISTVDVAGWPDVSYKTKSSIQATPLVRLCSSMGAHSLLAMKLCTSL